MRVYYTSREVYLKDEIVTQYCRGSCVASVKIVVVISDAFSHAVVITEQYFAGLEDWVVQSTRRFQSVN